MKQKRYNYTELHAVVKRIREGDSNSFSRLYELTYQDLYFFILSMLKNKTDAQDALQETYIRIYSNLHTLKNETLFIPWAKKIAYNISLRMLEKPKDLLASDELLASIPDDEQTGPEETILKLSYQQQLAAAINKLDTVSRTVIILKYFDELKLSQIAEIMDCPVGTVKSRLNTAKKALKAILKKERSRTLMIQFINLLSIKQALAYIASESTLEVQAADTVFGNVVANAGLSPTLSFTPQAAAIPAGSAGGLVATGATAATGCIAAVTTGSLLLSSPAFVSVEVHAPTTGFTRTPVAVTAMLEAPSSTIREVYALSHETNQKIPGILEDNQIARFSLFSNGEYTLYARNNNNKEVSITTEISCIDTELPHLKNYQYTSEYLQFHLEDTLSGLDYASVYGETVSGKIIYPQKIDETTGNLFFAFPQEDFYLHVRDQAGNESKFYIERYTD